MLMTMLKIVAGVAVLGIIALVLMAVVSGLRASVGILRRHDEDDDNPQKD